MTDVLSLALFAAAATGLTALAIQLATLHLHLRRRPAAPAADAPPPISILKPLCGVDDGLEENLEHFATLDHPSYELLLGVRDTDDPAWPLALACARRHPGRVRVRLQRGAPGLNPKVNQLVTLAGAARHELLVVSDSNVRVRPGYLRELAAGLADPDVGLVTNPIVASASAASARSSTTSTSPAIARPAPSRRSASRARTSSWASRWPCAARTSRGSAASSR